MLSRRGVRRGRRHAVPIVLAMFFVLLLPGNAPAKSRAIAGLAAAPEEEPHFGYNEDWMSERGKLAMAHSSGADTARVNIPWSEIEPQKGRFNWAPFDRLYTAIVGTGMRPLLVLTDAPCWAYAAHPGTCPNQHDLARPPRSRHLDSWARFAGFVAARYPLALGIEVWNEPNFNAFWRSGRPNPARYGHLLAAAFRGIKRSNPGMQVVSAGLVTSIGSEEGAPYLGFMRRALEVAGPSHYNAVGVHPYPFFTEDPVGVVREDVEAVRELLTVAGQPEKPIWVTEVGVSTAGPDAHTETQQAWILGAIYDLLAATPDLPVIIVHRFVDDPWVEGSWEPGFGVISQSGIPKRVYCALAVRRSAEDGLCWLRPG